MDVKNPFNSNQVRRVSLNPKDVDCIIFWSKNPAPLLEYISELSDYKCGFQYTLNDYPKSIETAVPDLNLRTDTFKRLSDTFGSRNVIWRYDPMIISRDFSADFHAEAFGNIARQLNGFTNIAVISFVDHYRRINKFWKEAEIRDPSEDEIEYICRTFSEIARENGMRVQSCAEKLPLEKYGVLPGACLDSRWIADITGKNFTPPRAKAQRSLCRCVESADIGTYGTCKHGCKYCYAGR